MMRAMGWLAGAALVAVLAAPGGLRAEEGPDELYRQGRFGEAEKIYGRLDMDRPRDLRYRYNRGCAALQKGDLEAAAAAFASVLRRAEKEELRFRAAFNLGSVAFQQEDFVTSADWYRQALRVVPESEDARHNLELALREAAKSREKKEGEETTPPPESEEGEGSGEEGEPSSREDGNAPSSGSPKEEPESESSDHEGEGDESGDVDERGEGESERGAARSSEKEPDLTGELSLAGDGASAGEESEDREGTAPAIDRKAAKALLDNVREDRSRFLRFQIPEGKERGTESGKDW